MVEKQSFIWISIISFIFRLQRLVKDLLKHLQGQDSGQWANNKVSSLDRTLGELSRILEKQARRTDCTELHFLVLILFHYILNLSSCVHCHLYARTKLTFSLLQNAITLGDTVLSSILLYWYFKNMFSRQTFLLLCVKLKLLNIL